MCLLSHTCTIRLSFCVCCLLQNLHEDDLLAIVDAAEPVRYSAGEVVAMANMGPCHRFFLVRSGEVLVLPGSTTLGPMVREVDPSKAADVAQGRLSAGDLFNERVLISAAGPLDAHLVAGSAGTVVINFELTGIEKALGGVLHRYSSKKNLAATAPARTLPVVNFADLEQHRVVGTGQFGLVRVVRHVRTNEVYALKVMHKAPLVEQKQIEHVMNERRILGEADHPFLVRLVGAYQDANTLYLLQVRVVRCSIAQDAMRL